MEHLPDYYTVLFNGVTDALTALAQNDPRRAEEILVESQQQAEELFIAGHA